MHYPLMQSLNIIAGMLGKKVSTMWCMKMEWGVWRVEGSAAAVSRLQTACREKLMNTAALQCGPIRGEHSCHVTGSPPMRGPQWLCKQSGHMQPQPGASTQVFAVRFLHHHPVPSQAWSHSAHWGLPAIYS